MYRDRHDPPIKVVDAPGHEGKFHDAESLPLLTGIVVAGCQPPRPVVRHGTTTKQKQRFNDALEFISIKIPTVFRMSRSFLYVRSVMRISLARK